MVKEVDEGMATRKGAMSIYTGQLAGLQKARRELIKKRAEAVLAHKRKPDSVSRKRIDAVKKQLGVSKDRISAKKKDYRQAKKAGKRKSLFGLKRGGKVRSKK